MERPPDEVNLGASPFRGRPLRSPAEVEEYFTTKEFERFAAQVHDHAAALDVEVRSFEPVVGLWEGDLEPAASMWVVGEPEAVEAFAQRIRASFLQDAVLVFTPDRENGEDVLLVLHGVADVEQAKTMLDELGVRGGRFVDGALEIADDTGDLIKPVEALARKLGVRPQYVFGRINLVERDTT